MTRPPCSRLRDLCLQTGLSFDGLAQEVGVTTEALRKIDRGHRQPLITTALRLASALGVDVEDIFGGKTCR